jgi:hypothetical protein
VTDDSRSTRSGSAPSAENRQVARVVDEAFGGERKATEHSNRDGHQFHLLTSPDTPQKGLISFCTIGLSDFQPEGKHQPPLGVELTAVSPYAEFADVVTATGLYAIQHGWLLRPGLVVLGVVAEQLRDAPLPHLLLLEPFLWDEQLDPRVLTTKTVAWVLGVPISQAEAQYSHDHGFAALDHLFGQAQPDHFDLSRASIVRQGRQPG